MGRLIKKHPPQSSEGTQKETKPKLSIEERVKELEKITEHVNKELRNIEEMRVKIKSDLAEFIFQTITLVIALLALIVVVPLGLITQFNLTDAVKIDIILTTLILITFLLIILVGIWGKKHFKNRGKIDCKS